jgi:hypothetical protein
MTTSFDPASTLPPSKAASPSAPVSTRHRFAVGLILCAGLLLPPCLLIGESLIGRKVLCPVDLLSLSGVYLPETEEYADNRPKNLSLTDLVLYTPARHQFLAEEYRAGRIPTWNPLNFAGGPYVRTRFSLFEIPYLVWPTPVLIAWEEVWQALVAGCGMYVFARRVLGLGRAAALCVAWSYPLTAYFVLWQGYLMTRAVALLPWMLWLTNRAVARPTGMDPALLALATATLVFTYIDTAAQVLLASGLYGVWLIATERKSGEGWQPIARRGALVSAAWGIGLLMAAPEILPLRDALRGSARIAERAGGKEERPPVGFAALPQIVLPNLYGRNITGTLRWDRASPNQFESSASTFVGLLATLALAPLAFGDRERRAQVWFLTVLAVLSCAWTLSLPGLVELLRLPGVKLLPHNRFVFAGAFALVALAGIGFDHLWRQRAKPGVVMLLSLTLLGITGLWCCVQAAIPPEPLVRLVSRGAEMPAAMVAAGQQALTDYAGVNLWGGLLCGAGVMLLVGVVRRAEFGPTAACVMAGLNLVELLMFAGTHDRQGRVDLYFPKIPALEWIAQQEPGRVFGVSCLPPSLNRSHGLRDVRGYDSIDPADYLTLIRLATDDHLGSPRYARTTALLPKLDVSKPVPTVHPVLNLLNVRYLVFRQPPSDRVEVAHHEDDYWIVRNPAALPRAFVPARAINGTREQSIGALGRFDFDPAALAVIEGEAALPTVGEAGSTTTGSVEIVDENPVEVRLVARMNQTGVVVLSDLFANGWSATVDGQPVDILRANIALRGVVVPKGEHRVVFTYRQPGLRTGFVLTGVGLVVVLVWGAWVWRNGARDRTVPGNTG